MKGQDDDLKKILLEIESFSQLPIHDKLENKTIELHPYPWLISNLTGGMIGTLIVRTLLSALNVNEHHVFRWRLENKYRQYLVLNHYSPGCMPETISLSIMLNEDNGIEKTRELFKTGFFLKASLGECSGKMNTFDRTAEFDAIAHSYQEKQNDSQNEKWILQKRLNLKNEFRIHSFGQDIICGLTFKTRGPEISDYSIAEDFVKRILEKLPATILQGSLIAWDIGLTHADKYQVIEANFTGFHPEYNYGFQTSGYFQDHTFGAIICAWLNNYLKYKCKISIAPAENHLLMGSRFYQAFMFYITLFKNEHYQALKNKKEEKISVIIYLGEETNLLLNKLITYLQVINYAEKYYLITTEEGLHKVSQLYLGDDRVNVLAEKTLFNNEQYEVIEQFKEERRKKLSCYHALRSINDKNCVII